MADLLTYENVGRAIEVCVACYSRNRDELGQWRAYGDSGRGFALGLAPHLFATVEEAPTDKPNFLAPIMYGRDHVGERHRSIIRQAVTVANEAHRTHRSLFKDSLIRNEFLRVLANYAASSHLIWSCATSKHEAYANEEEVRLVAIGRKAMWKPHMLTRARGSEIVPYTTIPMSTKRAGDIVEIVIGPSASAGAEDSLRVLTESIGLENVQTPRSDIPYRAL
jgi:hypothetical protein